jgi:T1SS-143 domain-containing protein
MTEDFARADDTQLAQANAGGSQAQDAVTVFQPPNGGEILLQTVAGQVYDLQFDPRLAEVRVIDVDGDQDLDVVLVFNAGTSDESRIVFKDMVDAAQSGNPPMLQLGNAQFGADVMVQQAQALTGEQPTLETAAPPGQEAEGTGVTEYDDNLGTSIDLMDPQGVIAPVEMTFPSPEPSVDEDSLLDIPPPLVEVRIGAGAEFDTILIKEDATGSFVADQFIGDPDTLVSFSASATNGFLTIIEIAGFDNLLNWNFDTSAIEAAALNLGAIFSFDGSTLTVDLTGLGLTSLSHQFTASPPPDSDVDLGTLMVMANVVSAVDPSLTGSGMATAEVLVDAVADPVTVSVSVVDGADAGDTFQPGETGQVSVNATFGDADDGSETHTVTVDVPADFTVSNISDGGFFSGGTVSWIVAGGVTDFDATFDVTYDGVEQGVFTFDAKARATETTTGDVETDTSDNLETATDSADATIARVPVTEADIGATNGAEDIVVKEDSGLGAAANDVSITAGVTDGVLTTIVISGFDSSWTYDFSGLSDLGTVTDNVAGDGTVTIDLTGEGQTSFSGGFEVQPPADTDVDLGTLTVTVNGQSTVDPALTDSDVATAYVAVDAILDEAVELGADGSNGGNEADTEQTFSLNLDSSVVQPFAGSGDGGADTDGSESTVVLLTLDAALPAGASLSSTAGTVAATGNPNEFAVSGADIEAAIDGLQVTVPVGFSGTISGSLSSSSSEANTPEGTVAASGDELDETDNSASDSVDFSVTVTPGDVGPEAVIGLPTGVVAIKEDSTDNVVEFSAQSGDATDELTSVVIELPGVGAGNVDVTQIESEAGVASVVVSEAGGTTTITVTFDDAADLTSFSSSFTLDAPVEDSDVDLTGVTITANAKDTTDAAQTGSGNFTTTIVVDAILDEAVTIAQSSVPEVDESTSGSQTILLGLDFSMVDAGFTGSLSGGSDMDGSESVTSVTISLSDGTLILDAGYAGSASLADNGGGNWTLSGWGDLSDLEAAVEALSVTVGVGFDGTVTGSISTTTQEANTPEGMVPASGDEPDETDNVVNGSFDFSLVVDSLPTAGDFAIAVDDDDLPSGNSDVAAGDDLLDPSPTVIMGTLNFDFGADSAGGTVDFAALDTLAVLDTGSNPVTSGAVALVYSWNVGTNTLTALAGATPVFTVVLTDPSAGDFTFTLLEPIDHPTVDTEDNIQIAMSFTATDGDGDTTTGTLTLDVDDDAPEVVTAASALLGNHQGGDAATEQLNFFETVGADRGSDADVVFVNNELDNKLRGSIDGDPAKVLTSGGHEILLTGFDSGTLLGFTDLNDNGLIDDGAGSLILQIDLNPDVGDESLDTYTIQLLGMIDNGEQITFDDFSGIGGNNNVFFPLNSSNDPSAPQDLLITATVPGTSTVNTDSDDIGTGDQWLNNDDTPADGEILRLDYVENVTGDPDDISMLTYTQHYVVNDTGFRLNQLQSNDATSRSVLVRVYDEDDDPQGGAIDVDPSVLEGDAAEQDDITTVRIERGIDEYVFLADGAQDGITVTFNADGSVKIDGLFELDQVFVSTADGFTQMEIQNVTSGGTNLGIALDNFLIGVQQSGDPIDLSFDLEVTDSDGDTNSGSLGVTLLPQLNGTSGNDTLESNGDAEILVGGLGNDTLTGGGEADIFGFNLGVDDGDDTITDFTGSEDILKFIDVVDGAGNDIQDVDDMITSIVNDGTGDVQVNFTNGGSIVFEDIAFAAQTSIAHLVDNNMQVVVDHM